MRLKSTWFVLSVVAAVVVVVPESAGQQRPDSAEGQPTKTEQPSGGPASLNIPPRAELEKTLQESLSGATLEGIWQMTGEGGLKGTTPLTDPKPDKYTISSATKLVDDQWVISARIEFGDKDVTVPVPVRVVWAEDTAVITLNDLTIPLIGTYSARVMIHHGFYSGVWYCNEKNYGGVMQGRIVKEPQRKTDDSGSKEPTEKD